MCGSMVNIKLCNRWE